EPGHIAEHDCTATGQNPARCALASDLKAFQISDHLHIRYNGPAPETNLTGIMNTLRSSLKLLSLATCMLLSSLVACQVKPPVDMNKVIIFGKSKDAVTLDPADATDGESSA